MNKDKIPWTFEDTLAVLWLCFVSTMPLWILLGVALVGWVLP